MRTSIIYHLIIQTIKPLLKAWGLKKALSFGICQHSFHIVIETDKDFDSCGLSLTKSFLAFAVSIQTIIPKPLGAN